MNHNEFLKNFENFLESIDEESIKNSSSIQFELYVYNGKVNFSYGSPIGGWDSSLFTGFRFIDVKQTYDFIIRPIKEHGYLVIESVSSQSQLANVDLSRSSKFKIQDGIGFLYEDYTMTVGLGRRSVSEIKSEFQKLGFDENGLIAQFNIDKTDFTSLLIQILKWAEKRQEVKYVIQKKINESKRPDKNPTTDESNNELVEKLNNYGKNFTHRDKKDIEPTLGVKSIAYKLSEQIKQLKDEEGQVVGIFGRWGRGKTFLINELLRNLGFDSNQSNQRYTQKHDFYFVKIHAWKYKEENAFWAYLYETAAEEYYKASYWPKGFYYARIIWLNLFRLGWIKSLFLILPFIGSLIWWKCSLSTKLDFIGWILSKDIEIDTFSGIKNAVITLAPFVFSSFLFLKNVLPKASKLFTTITKKHSFKDELGFQAKVQDEFKILLKAWIRRKKNNKRVLIIVDDLDRCQIDKIVPIADALRIILEDNEIIKRTIVITLVDEKILQSAINKKYELINIHLNESEKESRTKEYLDKLFLTGLKLPNLIDSEKLDIINELTKDHVDFKLNQSSKITPSIVDSIPKKENIGNKSNIKQPEIFFENKNNEDIYHLSIQEKNMLDETILKLKDPTPRQIKIFYYRYLMLKLIDESEDFGLMNFLGEERFVKISFLLLLQKHLPKFEANSITFTQNLDSVLSEISDLEIEKLKALIEMVVPY